MRIAIVTPGHLASNPRVVKEAEALTGAGHDIEIVHGQSVTWLVDADTRLARPEWRVLTVAFGAGVAGRVRHSWQSGVSRLAGAAMSCGGSASFADLAISPVASDLASAAEKIPADLYIAHYTTALPAAARAAARHGAAYAFDAEDFHPGDWPDIPEHDDRRELIGAVESRHLPGAAYITAAAPGIAEAYAERYRIRRPSVVLNVFSKTSAPPAANCSGSVSPGPSIYWFSQTIGPDRGLECAVSALACARSRPHLYLRGHLAPGYANRLDILAKRGGVADRLHILPVAPPEAMVALAAPYDIGLVAETGATYNRRIALTNKLFAYMLAGLPSVISDVFAHRQFAKDADGAVVLYETDNPPSLAVALDSLLTDPARLAMARMCAYDLGQNRYNWEREQAVLLACAAEIDRAKRS